MNKADIGCRAIFIAAPASGQGKTTVTSALARLYVRQGLRVRVFKTGPDFIDPMVLAVASGSPVYQLDLWMGGEEHCRQLLLEAALNADVILVEGVMGLFDGEPSGAALAERFGLPIMLVVDASAMAQTFGALVHGLVNYRENLRFAGVVANRVASETHAELLKKSIREGIRWYGAMPRNADVALPSRHLGLMQAAEIADLEQRIDKAADMLESMIRHSPQDYLPPLVNFENKVTSPRDFASSAETLTSSPLAGKRIAVAYDKAFAFVYPANLDVLKNAGAELIFFSPLSDAAIPDADALYLPGGYPELHLEELSSNQGMSRSILSHHEQKKPMVAECGGMLYLLETLSDKSGNKANMVGVIQGEAILQSRLENLGLHEVTLPEGTLRGHTFHHSRMQTAELPMTHTSGPRGKPEPVFRLNRLHASYLHLYFPSNPQAAVRLFQ